MENKVIRVAQVMGHFGTGGVESVIMNYYRHIDKTKFQFDFFVEEGSNEQLFDEIKKFGGEVNIIPKMTKILTYERELKKSLLNKKYDVVQANLNSLSFIPLRIAKKAKVKVRIANSLSTTHILEGVRFIVKNILKIFSTIYATHFFYCSDIAGIWLFGKKIKQNNAFKITNAIDQNKFYYDEKEREKLRTQYNINNKVLIGNIGRLSKQKNQELLIEIFDYYHKINPQSALIIIGDGKYKEKIIERINELNLKNDVILIGKKEIGIQNKIGKYYSMIDIMVMPSIYEGLPMVGVEGQISGLPFIFSSTISKEVKLQDNCKFLLLDAPLSEWTEAIDECLEKTTRQNTFFELYDIKIQTEKIENIYKYIVSEER